MPRRRTVALASAAALLATGVLAAGLAVGVTQTGTGQAWVRRTLLDALARQDAEIRRGSPSA